MKKMSMVLVVMAVTGCTVVDLAPADASMAGAMKFEEPQLPVRVIDDAGAGLERKVSGDKVQITEEMIEKLLAQKNAVVFPMKLAVVKITGKDSGYRPEALSAGELKIVRLMLKDAGRLEGVETVSSFFLTRETDLRRLRYAAARIGCSGLFVYRKDTTTARGWNSTANLNFLVLPLFFVNGKTVKAESAMEGVFVSVGSNVAHLASNSRVAQSKDIYNLASSDDALESLRGEVESEALRDLSQELARKLAELK